MSAPPTITLLRSKGRCAVYLGDVLQGEPATFPSLQALRATYGKGGVITTRDTVEALPQGTPFPASLATLALVP